MACYKLSPSELTFLWEDCQRCFYLKHARKMARPWSPMPKIFSIIHCQLKEYFSGRRTTGVIDELPPGVFQYAELWVESQPITLPGCSSTCFIRGRFDTVIAFDQGGYAVVDFKTAESRDAHVELYSRQLHAYALALEQPAPNKPELAPVEDMGLLCVEPSQMLYLGDLRDQSYAYEAKLKWIACPRNDQAFLEFLTEVVGVLDSSEPPAGSADCPYCQYRDTARRMCL